MAYKRTRRGGPIRRRTMKRGFGIPKRATNAKKMARIAQAVVRKNSETKYTRTYHSRFLRSYGKIVTTATRDLAAALINRLADYPSVYTGALTINSIHKRIGNRIENVKTYTSLCITFMNYTPVEYEWNWLTLGVRIVVFSPLDDSYDGTLDADEFWADPMVANMATANDAPNPLYAPINRTRYRIYYDKVIKTKIQNSYKSVPENATIGTDQRHININMKPIRSVLFQTGSGTSQLPKYPKYNRFLAIIPYTDSDFSSTASVIRYQTIANMYFTDS